MPGLLRGVARTAVIAGTATAARNRVNKRQSERWAEQEAAEGPPQPMAESQPSAAATQDSTIEQLKELAQLKEQGILTEEEFAVQKAKILGS
jgi:putative oligomerization/nucleic acid binding protein